MVEVAIDDRWVVVRLAGEIDMSSAPGISRTVEDLQRTAVRDLRLDLSAVEFIDSQGLNLVAHAHRRAQELGGHLEVVGAQPAVARTFEICGLGHLLSPDCRARLDVHGVGR